MATPIPKRRWMQFGLRSMLLAITCFALWLGWISSRAREQREAVQVLREADAAIYYQADQDLFDPKLDAAPPIAFSLGRMFDQPQGRNWNDGESHGLNSWLGVLGEDYSRTVVGVDVRYLEGVDTDQLLTAIGRLHRLRGLDLDCEGPVSVSNADLVHLRHLSNLERLFLEGASVGDEGIAHLRYLANLRFLSLAFTKVTDGGLAPLQRLSHLEVLEINRTEVTDAGLRYLKSLKNLKFVQAFGSKVTNAGADEFEAAVPGCRVWIVPRYPRSPTGPE